MCVHGVGFCVKKEVLVGKGVTKNRSLPDILVGKSSESFPFINYIHLVSGSEVIQLGEAI